MTSTTDRDGFPLKACTRCGGTGRFGPTSVQGGACFSCGGTGWAPASKRVSQAIADLAAARRRQRELPVAELQVGDQVAHAGAWRTVEAIERGEVMRWSGVKLEDADPELIDGRHQASTPGYVMVQSGWRWTITLDGGEIMPVPFGHVRRRGLIDPAPYLAAAGL